MDKPPEENPKSKARKRLFADDEPQKQSDEERNRIRQAQLVARMAQEEKAYRRTLEDDDAEEEKENKPEQGERPEGRPSPFKKIFTRNYPKLENQVQTIATPERRQAVIQEARGMTPFLTHMYRDAFNSDNPEHPTPIKTTERHTRQRSKSLKQEDIERLAREQLPAAGYHVVREADEYGPIYQNDELIDLFRQDEHGRTNYQRMLEGNPPVGPDVPSSGHPEAINLHHLVQGVDPGPLAELSATLHRRETAVLHRGAPGIENRNEFDDFRRRYWESRVYDLLECNHQGIGLVQN